MAAQAQRFLSSRTRWIAFVVIILLSVYLLAVTPIRTYLDQKSQVHEAAQRYALLAETNKQMQDRVQQLQSDEEIARLARERYELVPPGTKAFSVMPSPAATASPENKKNEDNENKGFWHKVWDGLTFWS